MQSPAEPGSAASSQPSTTPPGSPPSSQDPSAAADASIASGSGAHGHTLVQPAAATTAEKHTSASPSPVPLSAAAAATPTTLAPQAVASPAVDVPISIRHQANAVTQSISQPTEPQLQAGFTAQPLPALKARKLGKGLGSLLGSKAKAGLLPRAHPGQLAVSTLQAQLAEAQVAPSTQGQVPALLPSPAPPAAELLPGTAADNAQPPQEPAQLPSGGPGTEPSTAILQPGGARTHGGSAASTSVTAAQKTAEPSAILASTSSQPNAAAQLGQRKQTKSSALGKALFGRPAASVSEQVSPSYILCAPGSSAHRHGTPGA